VKLTMLGWEQSHDVGGKAAAGPSTERFAAAAAAAARAGSTALQPAVSTLADERKRKLLNMETADSNDASSSGLSASVRSPSAWPDRMSGTPVGWLSRPVKRPADRVSPIHSELSPLSAAAWTVPDYAHEDTTPAHMPAQTGWHKLALERLSVIERMATIESLEAVLGRQEIDRRLQAMHTVWLHRQRYVDELELEPELKCQVSKFLSECLKVEVIALAASCGAPLNGRSSGTLNPTPKEEAGRFRGREIFEREGEREVSEEY
jgi:hypothetical protein